MKRPLADRLASRIDRRGPDECWPWTGSKNGCGYGTIRKEDGKMGTAHRLSFILAGGDPKTPVVRHTCDRPECCNPAHLVGGTQKENLRDMVERGRNALTGAKLRPGEVRRIRKMLERGIPQRTIAATFGIAQPTVSDILRGESWAT